MFTENIAKGLQVHQPDFTPDQKYIKQETLDAILTLHVDFHPQPIVRNIPSCVGDTTDFLQKLDKVKNIPNDCLLVTLDVKSSHTNIPNNEGIKAVREAYDMITTLTKQRQKWS